MQAVKMTNDSEWDDLFKACEIQEAKEKEFLLKKNKIASNRLKIAHEIEKLNLEKSAAFEKDRIAINKKRASIQEKKAALEKKKTLVQNRSTFSLDDQNKELIKSYNKTFEFDWKAFNHLLDLKDEYLDDDTYKKCRDLYQRDVEEFAKERESVQPELLRIQMQNDLLDQEIAAFTVSDGN